MVGWLALHILNFTFQWVEVVCEYTRLLVLAYLRNNSFAYLLFTFWGFSTTADDDDVEYPKQPQRYLYHVGDHGNTVKKPASSKLILLCV